MALAKREKYIGIGVGVVVGLLAIDRLWFSPTMARLDDANTRYELAAKADDTARATLSNADRARQRFKEVSGNTLQADAPAAQAQILAALRDYAAQADMTLSSLTPQRGEKEKGFGRVVIRAAGTGNMQQVSRFLLSLRTSKLPVRVDDVTINTRRDGADDLALSLNVSTIHNEPAVQKPAGSLP